MDAVYIRDISKIEGFSDAQVMHLAVLASAVFESHSLTLFCLDHLVARRAVPANLPALYVDSLPASMRIEGDNAQGQP